MAAVNLVGRRARITVISIAIAAVLVGCDDPYSQIYVVNEDDGPYYVAYSEPSAAERIEGFVAAGERGLLLDIPGEIEGVVELRGTDCALKATVAIRTGISLVSIRSGSLHVETNADLSSLPVADLRSASDCVKVLTGETSVALIPRP